MKLWRLTDPEHDYDELASLVVWAETEADARMLASGEADRDRHIWYDAGRVTCEEAALGAKPKVVHTHVHYG